MFERILVPLDGSTRAERAIPVAARLAHAPGGSVILVRVVSISSSLWPSAAEHTALAQQVLAADLTGAERYLAGIATSPEQEGVPTKSVVRFGPTVSTILAVADVSQADLIVLRGHGHTDIKRRLIMGSVAEKLARAASVPVLVLGEDGPVPGEAHPGSTRPLRASPTGWLGSCRGSAGACGLSAHRPGRLCPRRAPPDARRPASAH